MSNALAALRYQGGVVSEVQSNVVPIATGGNTDTFVIAPQDGILQSVDFSAQEALAASDSNYVSFSIMNLGQNGIGTNQMLAVSDKNTTKLTGGTAIQANSRRKLTIGTGNVLNVKAGDRIRIRAAATGTLPNGLNYSVWLLKFVA